MARKKLEGPEQARAKALAHREDGIALTIFKDARDNGYADRVVRERGLTGEEADKTRSAVQRQLSHYIARISKRMQMRLGGSIAEDKADIFGEPDASEVAAFQG